MNTDPTTGKTIYPTGPVPAFGEPGYNPGPADKPNPLVQRYAAQTPAPAPIAAPENPNAPSYLARDVNGNIVQNPGIVTVNPLREASRAAAQGTVDVIKQQWGRVIEEDKAMKRAGESKAYLSALSGGLAFSPTGAAQTKKAADAGQKKVQQDTDTMNALVNQAFANADLRATQDFMKQQEEYLAAAKDQSKARLDLTEKVKKEAEGEITTFASRYSYSEWAQQVGAPRVQQYMRETGLDEEGIKALFLKGAKDDIIDKDGTKLSDGSVVFLKKKYDTEGNVIGTTEVGRVAGTGGKTIKESRITDNGVQVLYTDGTYEIKGTPGNNPKAPASNKPIAGTPQGFTEDDVQKGKDLFTQFGKNGYAEPAFYVDAYQKWVSSGGTAAKFLQLYPPNIYIDYADRNLVPTYMQPTADKTKVKSASPITPAAATTSGGRTY